MLIEGLPPDSALHRAANGGQLWGINDDIQWKTLGAVEHVLYFLRGYLKVKPHQDKFEFPATPWDTTDQGVRTYGQVNDGDQEAAVEFLMALMPQ